MVLLSTWNTLFEGKYGNKELNILYQDDVFVSFLKVRDQNSVLVQVYKVFLAKGDIEVFVNTLPYPAVIYQKHIDIGENNTYKYLLFQTDVEYIDINTLSYHIDKKILELNKRVGSIISIISSYDIKLTSLKLAGDNDTNFFFSDPIISKILTNLKFSFDFSGTVPMNKLILGKKNNILVTTDLEQLNSVAVFGSSLNDRVFSMKIVCENFLLSSKTVIIFDITKMFSSLGFPQQNNDIINDFNLNMDPFGFPVKNINYLDIKIPLFAIPKNAFLNIFKFAGISAEILSLGYTSNILDIKELIVNIKNLEITETITQFEKQRVISKLVILDKSYSSVFGETDLSVLFEQRYKHIGSVKILNIDDKHPFYVYYVNHILDRFSNSLKDDILIVLPESKNILNNLFVGSNIFSILKNNSVISSLISSKAESDFKGDKLYNVKINMVDSNDGVVYYPNKDPLRILFRPTFTSSIISYKKPKEEILD
ncbi:MAG: hypothetical protein WCY27_03315 [archaeon]|nr:hypothetical protein [archaeon]MDD2478070.1 hypothetical protein [Candidatus ainarchaeum sp.]MDD3084942.1 hypothetical protein [Candidatus ainarchaeum sp.]MDD4221505.1 hypothetical protein [Candidatus ainarchaeum sp.]MDD4663023.1 hypothetical protein [Candidatus ainarchaeum sp.]